MIRSRSAERKQINTSLGNKGGWKGLRKTWRVLIAISLLLTACWTTPKESRSTPETNGIVPTATSSVSVPALGPDDSPVVISEVMAGKQGNNNFEFIELYNRSPEVVDLKGWALWYRLPTSKEDLFVYRWAGTALVAPQGHLLLALKGEDIGILPDGEYQQALNLNGGGLQLRQLDGDVRDRIGWGKAPEGFHEGTPAPALVNGQSLQRLPGGARGSFQDQDDNIQDFVLESLPDPQNSSSPQAPLAAQRLEVTIEAPETSTPGSTYEYTIKLKNLTGQDLQGVKVTLPMPAELAIPDVPAGMELEMVGSPPQPIITWSVGPLPEDSVQTIRLVVAVPYTYFTAVVRNYTAQAENWSAAAYGGAVRTEIAGGVIPIGTARTLLGSEMTIEGIATMYTGGYFAGSGNNKFYLQDETGGIQVQVFGGQGEVSVKIGDRVRVRGEVSVYRGSVQIVPIVVPEDVQVLEPVGSQQMAAEYAPMPALISDTQSQPGMLSGRLVQVQGDITRVEEFTYSYEIDLVQEAVDDGVPASITLYVDKQAGINVEDFVPGQQMTAAGILDVRDTVTQLYPRQQTDLAHRYPPVLLIEANAPNNVQPGEIFTVTLTVFNHLVDTVEPLVITGTLPTNATLQTILDGGAQDGELLTWQVPSLAGNGSAAQVHFQVSASQTAQPGQLIEIGSYGASAPQAETPAEGSAFFTFIGDGVPVWAIQGSGTRSPYSGRVLTTQGIVTGIFPELGGFFIQEEQTDLDASTSAGLFVVTGVVTLDDFTSLYPELSEGARVQVSGKVREPSQQTVIEVLGPQDVTVLSPDQVIPTPTALDPPAAMADALPYFEALEGMLVTVSGPALAVSPVTQYGEYVVVLPRHNQSRLFQGEDNGIMIMVDDGSAVEYPDGSSLPYLVSTGDQVDGLVGPLAFTYGRFKIEPTAPPQVTAQARELPALTPAAPDEFTLMTWNVENLFDTQDPHPADPPKPRLAEYQRDLDKVASTIAAAGFPTIVGLQEVENINVLKDIAAHSLLESYGYQPVLFEGNDSRGIDVGFLVRSDQATILDAEPRPAPEGLFSRPPLLLHVEVSTNVGEAELYVINNHFVSMSSGEEATEPQRTAQAAWNATLVEEILAADPQAWVAVIGDLNSFFASAPIDALRAEGLIHAMDNIPAEERYTYIYQGESQVLDHILLTTALNGQMVHLEVLHVNADYPLAMPDDASPQHKSDHDPVIATFTAGLR